MTPEHRPARGTYIGLFLVALATLMYEILLTRIFSVTMLYHFAFVALSVAMFGMTVGALIVYLSPRIFTPDRLDKWLAVAALAFPLVMVLSFLTQLSVPFRVHPSIVALYAIGFTYAVIAVPFVVSGIVVCLSLTGFPARVSRLYAADLAGAAAGCVLLIPVLDYSDGPTAVLWVSVLASLGAIAFAGAAGGKLRGAAIAVTLVLGLSAAANTVLVWKHFPVFRILYIKGSFEARPLYEKWNSYSRVRVNGNQAASVEPQGWGLSRALPPDLRVHQLQMDIDVVAGTVMTGYDGNASSVRHLGYDVTNLGYRVRPPDKALVIGAGGGRDVLSALTLGASSVVAVEINKDILRTVNGRFGDFTGHLDRDPRVRFVNDEARSYVARSREHYGLIQISLIDTWAATAAGAFVLSENAIYTTEAWTTFLRHLTPDGLLSVSRWYYGDRPAEMYRTTTLAVESLRQVGVTNPRSHLVIVRNMTMANRPETPDGVGTLLVSRRPFTDAELAAVDRVSAEMGFEVMFSPRVARDDVFIRLTAPDADAFVASYPLRINAPTDNSPFFFNMLRLRDIFRLDRLESGKQSNNLKAVATLGGAPRRGVDSHRALHSPAAVDVADRSDRQPRAAAVLRGDWRRLHAGRDLPDAATHHHPGPPDLRAERRALRPPAVERDRQLPDCRTHRRRGDGERGAANRHSGGGPPRHRAGDPGGGARDDGGVDAAADRDGGGAALSRRPDDGDGVSAGDEDRVAAGGAADAVAVGRQRRGVGAGLGAERLHRARLVHFRGVLHRLRRLRARGGGLQPRRP